jgi:hypothetical protein
MVCTSLLTECFSGTFPDLMVFMCALGTGEMARKAQWSVLGGVAAEPRL